MYDYLRGQVVRLDETAVILDVGGVGYRLEVSGRTLDALPAEEKAAELLLYCYSVIRDNALQLYGFSTLQERTLFEHLITVPSVGPSVARQILSDHSAADLIRYIIDGETAALKRAKGVGEKTANRIVVELQRKFDELFRHGALLQPDTSGSVSQDDRLRSDALLALRSLGFNRSDALAAIEALLDDGAYESVEALIRDALRRL